MSTTAIFEAIDFARQAHGPQRDKGGVPYIFHLLGVLGLLPPHASDAERIAAVLHDVVEDTRWTLLEIHERFGHEVGDIVDSLTHRSGETNDSYMSRVELHRSAIIVKLADMHHNSLPARQSNLHHTTRARLAAKYAGQTERLKHTLYDTFGEEA